MASGGGIRVGLGLLCLAAISALIGLALSVSENVGLDDASSTAFGGALLLGLIGLGTIARELLRH